MKLGLLFAIISNWFDNPFVKFGKITLQKMRKILHISLVFLFGLSIMSYGNDDCGTSSSEETFSNTTKSYDYLTTYNTAIFCTSLFESSYFGD